MDKTFMIVFITLYLTIILMTDLPYCNTLGNIPKYFEKIRQAETPRNRFSIDFLKNTLNFTSGNDTKLMSLLKAMKFLDESGNPLQLYRDFRSESTQLSKSIGIGIRNAYSALFARDKDIHTRDEETVKGHIMAVTDRGEDAPIVRLITQTFLSVAKLADFSAGQKEVVSDLSNEGKIEQPSDKKQDENKITLTHTIVLNLPTTTTKEVYDKIFASLKENLLNS